MRTRRHKLNVTATFGVCPWTVAKRSSETRAVTCDVTREDAFTAPQNRRIFFARRQQLIKSCDQDNFTGTVCNSARGAGSYSTKKTCTLEPIHDEPMSIMWRDDLGTCLLLKTIFVSQETSVENIAGFSWGLSIMMLQCMPYMGLCFFQHPRIGQFLGGPCCFWLNYSDLGHCMASNLVWI